MNIYIGVLIVGIIFSVNPVSKKMVMKDMTKDEFQIYGLLLFLIFSFILSRFNGGFQFKDPRQHKFTTLGFLLFSSSLVFVYSNVLNTLLKDNEPDMVMFLIKAIETLSLFLIASFFNKGFTLHKMFGVILILGGSYLYQKK